MASGKLRSVMESAVSLLAGIPSVVYGLVGMLVLVPGIRKLFHVPDGASLLAAMIVLAIMLLNILAVTLFRANTSNEFDVNNSHSMLEIEGSAQNK